MKTFSSLCLSALSKAADTSEVSLMESRDFEMYVGMMLNEEWDLSSISHCNKPKESVSIQKGSTWLERNIFWI